MEARRTTQLVAELMIDDHASMTAARVRVLEIAAEGGGCELDAEIDEDGRPVGFYAWKGGAHGFEEMFHEEPEPSVAVGPLTWAEVLEQHLRPHSWLEHYPRSVHPAVAELVRKELPGASANARARWSAALPAVASAGRSRDALVGNDAFRASILRVYDRPNCIHPFVGDAFDARSQTTLRVMTIGINAYVSQDDWDNQQPAWFAGWFRDARHKFDRRVAADSAVVATALSAGSKYFSGLTYTGKQNVFHTNAVKVFMRESEGKRSDQLSSEHFREHVPAWHAELDVMAEHGVIPHVVVVFGRPFWEAAWQAFHPEKRPTFEHLTVHGFANAPGEGHHHANLIEVEGAAGKHHLALLCVRHPAARAAKKGRPDWLLALEEMRELLGLPPLVPSPDGKS